MLIEHRIQQYVYVYFYLNLLLTWLAHSHRSFGLCLNITNKQSNDSWFSGILNLGITPRSPFPQIQSHRAGNILFLLFKIYITYIIY